MANIAELERVMTFIKDHPEQHRQDTWTCNTGACFAGHAALMNGYQMAYLDTGLTLPSAINGTVVPKNSVNTFSSEDFQDLQLRASHPECYDVRTIAMDLLDLTDAEAHVLFSAFNTAEDLEMMIKDLANGEDITRRWKDRTTSDSEGRCRRAFYRLTDEEMKEWEERAREARAAAMRAFDVPSITFGDIVVDYSIRDIEND